MKKALLLHSTDGNAQSNWLPWLKTELEQVGWSVWVPDLPGAHEPNIKRYNTYLLEHQPWAFDGDTVIVGHSSGAMAALGLLQILPDDTKVKQTILIGSFKDDLGWPNLSGLFEEPYDFARIKRHARDFLFIHSDDDPYCPLDHARYLSQQLDAPLKVVSGQKHFSAETDPKYTTFPLLKQLLLETND